MATTTITNAARTGWFQADLDYTNTHKMALYINSNHDANSGAYTAVNEVTGTGYVAKGQTMTSVLLSTDTSNNVAFLDWDDVSWGSSTITSTDCMIFDEDSISPNTDTALYIGDFSGSKSSSSGTFQVVLPTAAFNTAIIRIA